jgi:hypothetical protein
MKRIVFTVMTLLLLASSGCATKTGSATAGALGGAAAGGGAYEYRVRQELQRIEDDFSAGKMDQKEYEIRKDQILRMSIVK